MALKMPVIAINPIPKDSAFQLAELNANAETGGLVKQRNITEVEEKARWPPVDNLPAAKPSDKEVIAIAKAKKPNDQGGMPLGI